MVINLKTTIANNIITARSGDGLLIKGNKKQLKTAKKMVKGYQTMVAAEEHKFTLGDSSLFLINSREAKLIEAKLKAIETENKLLEERANLILLNQQL